MGSYVMRLPGCDIELVFSEYFPGAGSRDIGIMCLFRDLVVVAYETVFRYKDKVDGLIYWVHDIERNRIVDGYNKSVEEKRILLPLKSIGADAFVNIMIEGCEKAGEVLSANPGVFIMKKRYNLV